MSVIYSSFLWYCWKTVIMRLEIYLIVSMQYLSCIWFTECLIRLCKQWVTIHFLSRTFKAQLEKGSIFPSVLSISSTLWSSCFFFSWIKSRAGPMTFLATLVILKSSFSCFFHFRSFWLIFFSRMPLNCFHIQISGNIIVFSVHFQPFYTYLHQSQYDTLNKMFKGEISGYIPNTVCKCQNCVEVSKTLLRVSKKGCVSWVPLVLREMTTYKAVVC